MRQLTLLDVQPRVAVRVESYQAVPHFVAGTDRIALMQERLAARLADRTDLRVVECPGQTEPIVEALRWHRQHEDDMAARLAAQADHGGRAQASARHFSGRISGRPAAGRPEGAARVTAGPTAIRRAYTQ